MAVAFVTQAVGGSSTASTTGPTTITAPSAGNVLVVAVAFGSSTSGASVSSVTATGGTFTRVAQSAYNATGTNRTEIWVGTGVTGTTVTCNFSASSKWAANVSEFSGLSAGVSTAEVTSQTNTGSTAGAATVSLPALASPPAQGDLIVGAMNIARSSSLANFTSATGSPDTANALTGKVSGATTVQNVNLSPLYVIATNDQPSETFSWGLSAAWNWAGAACVLRAAARTVPLTASLTIGSPIVPVSFQGYNQYADLTVTGGNSAVTGSTSTPTTTSSDYVVNVQLTGTQAASVFNNLLHQGDHSDLSLWYFNGTVWTQIDLDVDQCSATSVKFWFKLQANLSASPATDSNYRLAWGNSLPPFNLNSWLQIYPFSDDFTGTSLSTNWGQNGVTTLTVAGGILTVTMTSQINWQAWVKTVPTWGVGFNVAWYANLPVATSATTQSQVGIRSGDFTDYWIFHSTTTNENYQAVVASATVTDTSTGVAADATYHVYNVARDPSGLSTKFTLDSNTPVSVSHASDVNAKSIQISDYNSSATTAQSQTTNADWVKVRPYIATEPTVAMGTIPTVTLSEPQKTISYHMSGSMTPAGSILKSALKNLAASITSVGALVITRSGTIFQQALSASLSLSGAITLSTSKLMTASVTPAGSLPRAISHLMAASMTANGAIKRSTSKLLTVASMTVSGSLLTPRTILKSLSASLTPSGTLPRAISHGFTASLSATGSLLRGTAHGMTASITGAGTLTKKTTKILSGTMTGMSGSLLTFKSHIQILTASIAPSGNLVKATSHGFTATIAGAGSIQKTTAKILSGASMTLSGSLSSLKSRFITFTASLSPSGSLTRSTSHLASASLTLSGGIQKATAKSMSGAMTAAGSLKKATAKILSGASMTASGSLSTIKSRILLLSASLSATGSLSRATSTHLATATLSLSGGLQKATAKRMSASVAGVGSIAKTTAKTLSASLTGLHGTVTTLFSHVMTLSASLAPSGALRRSTAKGMAGTLAPVGLLLKGTAKTLSGATLQPAGALRRNAIKTLSGSITMVGTMGPRSINKALQASVSISGGLTKGIGHAMSASLTPTSSFTAIKRFAFIYSKFSFQVGARVFGFLAGLRTFSFLAQPRVFSFTASGNGMTAIATTSGDSTIGALEQNVGFSINFTTWLQGTQSIASATATCTGIMRTNPSQDISVNATALIQGSPTISGGVVTVPLGNKNALVGARYTLTIAITTNTGQIYQESIPAIDCNS